MKRKAENEDEASPPPADSGSSDDIHIIGTDIYFHTAVTTDTVIDLIKKVRKLEDRLLKKAVDLPGYKPRITIYIRSEGGDLYAGLSALDHLLNSKIRITTVADGICASAATLILFGGSKRKMYKHAYVLIHQLLIEGGVCGGKIDELKDEVTHCDQLMTTMKNIYIEYADIPKKKLNAIMKRDVYLSSEECLKYGIVHELACHDTA